METAVHESPPRLCDFIRNHRDDILEEWTRRVRSLPVANALSQPRLIDHLPELLDRISDVLRTADEGGAASLNSLPRVHALDRLDRGFDLKEVVSEYALLRRCAFDLYRTRYGETLHVDEVIRFNEAIDEAIRDSAHYYATQRLRVLAALDKLTTSSPAGLPLHDLLDRLLQVFVESTEDVDTSSILLLESDGRLRVRASIGLGGEVKHHWSVPMGEGFAGTIAATRRPLALRNAAEDSLPLSPYMRASKLRALYGVPLAINDELLGVAHMGSRTAYEFSEEDRALFRVLITRAAVFIYENILRRNAERRTAELEATIDAIPGEVIIGDSTSGITHANAAALAMMGVGSLSELEQRGRELASPMGVRDADDNRPLTNEDLPFWRAMLGETVRRDLRLTHMQRGEEIVVSTVAAPIRLHDAIAGAVCVYLDVTDRRKLEEAREQFVAILGHDLRSPLNAILLSTKLLEAKNGEEARCKSVDRIAKSAQRMEMMISDLLDFTRGRLGGGIPVDSSLTDLRIVCRSVVDEIESAHPDVRITIDVEGDTRGTWDPARLGQLVQNLVVNAIQHGDASAGVRIRIDGRERERTKLIVSNRGPTIPAELLPHLFEPFRRLANASEVGRSSLGLGLFIVSEIARAHRGKVSVRSTGEEGTSFEVCLPRAVAASSGTR